VLSIRDLSLEYADSPADGIGGLFASIRKNFRDLRASGLLQMVAAVYDFRNTYVAHQDEELKDAEKARKGLKDWLKSVVRLEFLFEPPATAS
jgi:type III restriction enzyme